MPTEDPPLYTRDLADKLIRLARFLEAETWRARALDDHSRAIELERATKEVSDLSARLYDMKARLVDAWTVAAFKPGHS